MKQYKVGLRLFRCAFDVIIVNKKLLLFPIIITMLTAIFALFFVVPIALWHSGYSYSESAHWLAVAGRWLWWDMDKKVFGVNSAGYVLLAGIYLLSMFLATFFNVAFYSQIMIALQGGRVSIANGLRVAWSRLEAILVWSLFAGLIGLIVKKLEERVDWFGRWIVGLIGLAWSVSSIFVIPVIVSGEECANPLMHLRSSVALLRRTWGEALVGCFCIQVGGFLALLLSIMLFLFSFYLSFRFDNLWFAGGAALIWFPCLMVYLYLLNVVNHVYRCALFVYASSGIPPAFFERDQMIIGFQGRGA